MIRLKHLGRLLACNKGSLMPLIGMAAVTMVTATGVALDVGRAELVQMKLFSSLDAAGLSAATNRNKQSIEPEAEKYLNVNFNNYLGAKITDFTIVPNKDNTLFTLHATAEVPAVFVKIMGIDTFTVAADSQIKRTPKGLELILVVDTSGSMKQTAGGSVTKITAAKTAASSMLYSLYGDKLMARSGIDKLWIGIVPFSQTVNIGNTRKTWLDATYSATLDYGPVWQASTNGGGHFFSWSKYNGIAPTYNNGFLTYTLTPLGTQPTFGIDNWRGCVEARGNGNNNPAYDLNDDPPSVKPFRPYFYPNGMNQNNWKWSQNNCRIVSGGASATCKRSHTEEKTCTNTINYPACCPANSESCINPANCGKESITEEYPCTQNICDEWNPDPDGPPVTECTSTSTTYDYSGGYSSTAGSGNGGYSSWMGTYKGPNAYCPREPVSPMMSYGRLINATINGLAATDGDTEIPLGLAWAWRMLSPRWQGLWGGDMNRDGLPLAYNTKGMTKAIILLTDGDNNLVQDTYTAYGPTMTSTQLGVTQCNGTNNCKPGINRLDSRTSELCRNMKDTNIIIYTVALGEEISSKGLAILQDCASSPKHFFLSPTTSELEGVFEQIAETLVNIRVSQ